VRIDTDAVGVDQAFHGQIRDRNLETIGPSDVELIDIDQLILAGSPRTTGLSEDHVRVLADLDTPLPPILVQRTTLRVVDGVHRVEAARRRGQKSVRARYFDGDEHDAFITAVRMNKAHGLPLTLAEREAAVTRIIVSHPHYSDRSIAAVTGLSGKTVGAIRRRAVPGGQDGSRIGADGRLRPVNAAMARRVVAQAIIERPDASLRQIAKSAGVSPGTVRDVRDRLRRGEEPVPDRLRAVGNDGPGADPQPPTPQEVDQRIREREALLQRLLNDPALKFNQSGRALLRWLYLRATELEEWPDRIHVMPPHCAYTLVELARSCSTEWQKLAAQLEHRIRETG